MSIGPLKLLPVKVYAPGVFDLFHIGHLNFLRKAAACGDELIIGIQDDRSVERQKGLPPVIPLLERVELLSALRVATDVVSYIDVDQSKLLGTIKPNVFACADSYGHSEEQQKTLDYCISANIKVVRISYTTEISSTLIKSRIQHFWNINKRPAMLTSFGGEKTAIQKETQIELDFIRNNTVSSQTLLDLGCGDGRLCLELVNDFAKIIGVDFSIPMIEAARQVLSGLDKNHLTFELCDVVEYVPSHQFDIALLSGLVVYHDDDSLRKLVETLDKYIDDKLVIRSPVGLSKRMDIINQVSPNFEVPYTAYYRTIGELLRAFSKCWKMTEAIELYRHHEDTAIWGMIFERSI
jgi:glycerol-3-phosphate cytidylyltransferase